ncbi:hypothetical protein CV093_12265 [Oceanobacillus sp. 143]|nr:hypothetical protein CV093_12265 [Oceanobacillus sp. 143]
MRQIALQILSVDRLIGTQYTTLIHPDNIYVTADGDVKFVFRGFVQSLIKNVLIRNNY